MLLASMLAHGRFGHLSGTALSLWGFGSSIGQRFGAAI